MNTLLQNRYELLEKIGDGGMAIVYKARCTLLDRIVAVKILKEESMPGMLPWFRSLRVSTGCSPSFASQHR